MKLVFLFLLSFIFFSPEISFSQNYKKQSFKSKRTIVEVGKVEKKPLKTYSDTIGRIVTLSPYTIVSKVNEQVKKKYVLEGDNLKKGQRILDLETKNIKRLIARFEEEIKFNKITKELVIEELSITEKKLKRFFKLKEKKIISDDVFDTLKINKIKLNKQIAKINFDLKKLSYQLMASREDLVETNIKSPVNGNLINFNVEMGAILNKGQKLATILVAKQNEVEVSIRSEKVSKIKVGSNVEIKNENNDIFFGKVRSIVGLENTKTGTRVIRITLPKNFPHTLNVPGRRLQVKIFMEDRKARLVFPKDALIVDSNKKYVYIVEKNLVKKISIKIGKSFKNQIEALEGLREGNIVVIKGNESLRNNQKVRVRRSKSNKS